MLEKLLFPSLTGKWLSYMQLNKYAELLREDFDDHTPDHPFLNPALMGEWVNLLHKTLNYDYSWGGYLEDRYDLLDGTYLPSDGRIHLGVDYWVPLHSTVRLPKAGKLVHSFYDPDMNGGWGGRVIYEIDGMFVIFGHLTAIPEESEVGKTHNEGQMVGLVADVDGSGGWYPHLHLQCMKTFNVEVDGYSSSHGGMLEKWFPNPVEFFNNALNNPCNSMSG